MPGTGLTLGDEHTKERGKTRVDDGRFG